MKAAYAVGAVVILLAISVSGCLDSWSSSGYYEYPESIEFQVRRSLVLHVSGPGTTDYTVKMMLPENVGSLQTAGAWSASPDFYTVVDAGTSDKVEWTSATSDTISFLLEYEVTSHTVQWEYSDSESGMQADVPDHLLARYPAYADEWKIRPTDPVISASAENITSYDDPVLANLRAIYDYVAARIEYETDSIPEPKDCMETLNDGNGDCDDQSILFCSLARAAGIPAWLEFGFLYDPADGTIGPHAWVATYLPLESGGGGKVNIDMANREFLLRTSNHITEWQDDGIAANLRSYYNITVYSAPPSATVSVTVQNDVMDAVESAETIKISAGGEEPVFIPNTIIIAVAPLAVAAVALLLVARWKRR